MTNDQDNIPTIELDDEVIEYPDQPNLPDEPAEPTRVGLVFGIYGPNC